ncbi:hypothetical protein FEE95_02510 [Maribacter algarum]|uniref:DUF4097 domain-containing protein n=1 Tax=Maribacter algarum (ex Zhang et al. 2020) TaxID=2578118 RepID=A0A5S3PTJ6_9FLAO|nr:hypothetical protein [Maribacter algarum]TMM58321.1 hypothetical protein FEE95_02510 [Maribacter algarum]
MKTVKTIMMLLVFLCCSLSIAQKSNETITEELNFSSKSDKNMLVVKNINGPIKVEGYDGNSVKIVAEKSISAKRESYLQEGKQEIQIKMEELDNKIYVYVETPNNDFNTAKGRYENSRNNRWTRLNYRFEVGFIVKVPKYISVELSTMNDGDIYAKEVQGDEIIVSNLNGAITLDNIAGKTDVNALNKDINITYYRNPIGDSKYHSLNGDVNVTFKDNLNADVSFKSLNGDLYTNYDTTALKPDLIKTKTKNGKGIKFNLSANQSYRIGKGGIKLDFNLLNGDATLKK